MAANNSVQLVSSYSDGRWMTFNYDLGYGYGYDSMIRVLDTLIEQGEISVEIVRKGLMADSPFETVWERGSAGNAPRLADMPALKEECGLVAVGGKSQTLRGCVVHIVMYNQSSGLRLETPEQLYLERIRSHDPYDRLAAIFQQTLLSGSRITPDNITQLSEGEIFVFGSNLGGRHGGGAARAAMEKFGAIWGQGVGLQGQSYAIPTMQGGVETIKPYVDEFIAFAKGHPQLRFLVTRIGCGIAGFTDAEIAPLFEAAIPVSNITLPQEFWQELTD